MNKMVKVTGFCPVQSKEYVINVTYVDVTTLSETKFVKGNFKCQHNIRGDKCNGNKCPIYHNADNYCNY